MKTMKHITEAQKAKSAERKTRFRALVKHTPGPWLIWRDIDLDEPLQVSAPSFNFVCTMAMENGNHAENASLIAAAPELLEALIECESQLFDALAPGQVGQSQAITKARQANPQSESERKPMKNTANEVALVRGDTYGA